MLHNQVSLMLIPQAIAKYSECLAVMERALSLPIVRPPSPNLSFERAGIMIQKLQKSK